MQEHLKDLEMNRYPQISRKLGREIPEIQAAVKNLSRLQPPIPQRKTAIVSCWGMVFPRGCDKPSAVRPIPRARSHPA